MPSKFFTGGLLVLAAISLTSIPTLAAETRTYTYDALGRVVKVENTGSVNNNQTRRFCYDKVGNRIEYDSRTSGTPPTCVTQG